MCVWVCFADETEMSELKLIETENEHIRIYYKSHFKIWTRVWQVTAKKVSRLLATEMETLRRSAGIVGWTD